MLPEIANIAKSMKEGNNVKDAKAIAKRIIENKEFRGIYLGV